MSISASFRPIYCAVALAIAAAESQAGAIKTVIVEGTENGPTVRVLVGRTEREKACGIDEQLAGFALKKGRLVIQTFTEGQPIHVAVMPGAAPEIEIALLWPKPAKDIPGRDRKRPVQRPRVAASEPTKLQPMIEAAVGDSLSEKSLDLLKVTALGSPDRKTAGQRIEIHFPSPRSSVSKARQFRISRRLAATLLADLGMIEPSSAVWPQNFPMGPLICNYDADGAGYYGSTLLERAVDETTLDVQVVPVCPEDIREGALDKADGVMFPGGSSRAIATALQPDGVAKVREHVGSGHGYYGVCAGAYLAASGLPEYIGMMHLKHDQLWAKGKGMIKLDLTPEGVALLGEEFTHIESRYNCGPVFPDLTDLPGGIATGHASVTVLARFASAATDATGVTHDSMIGTAAILQTRWKKGRIVTCSPHPESHPEFNVMVARCIGLSLGKDPKAIVPRVEKMSFTKRMAECARSHRLF